MNKNNRQSPNAIVMVRPTFFTPNPQTAADNMFQILINDAEKVAIAKKAYEQVTQAADILREQGVTVHLFDDITTRTPDSVFPNNWFSTHDDGTVVIYPMYVENRRLERRNDIIEALRMTYNVGRVLDYTAHENNGLYLEGTGAMVLDHEARIAYAVRSHRAHSELFKQFCNDLGYQSVMFDACDSNGVPVYHTNVMMCVASHFAMIGLEMISDADERQMVAEKLKASGREVIPLTSQQVHSFAGNAIELSAARGNILVLSQTAYDALERDQIRLIEQTTVIVPIDVSAIEMAGGSIRCMIAGIHFN
ncbi:citrulline utilization hydrolase CtlX [Kordiimonas aquimaris]|uniref:citrulline utilization hydrolase CtlX n=1 Tax=Kordiimonas aquimaris TaxID=707591 RepID=UPI0021D04BC6|nr:arginine deiminase-related protein [Kordiimonas aquimaris]